MVERLYYDMVQKIIMNIIWLKPGSIIFRGVKWEKVRDI